MNGNGITTLKGDKIGPWKLGSTLGIGSTGKVVMASNENTGQQAAVKIISKSIFNAQGSTIIGGTDPDVLPYGIEREIIIMKLLNHPNVLRLYDVWETSKDLYMVLEYVEKGELFNLLVERGPLPENEAVRFFRQIIIGISYCHALGIVHRDLKPENLLLDHKYNVKLADFGMAALESKDKLLETSCGSPHYAAPEIVSGLPYHGFESDVWSCGVILYALLTGRLPFDEEDGNIRNLLLKVQSGKYEMPGDDEISHEAQDLIAKILTVDPEQRIKTREILKHPLLKRYPSIKDSKSIRNLPREDTYLNPLSLEGGNERVDENILQNLVVLWHGRNKDEITAKLKEPGPNLEKTFYALLHRFKHDNYQEQLKQQELQKKSSISSNSLMYVGYSPSPNKLGSPVSTPKKKRSSIIVASSSHKRPVSIQKLSSQNSSPVKNGSIGKRLSKSFSSNKRISVLVSNSSSPTPSSHKRISRLNDGSAPPVPKEMLRDYKRQSKRQSKRFSLLPNMKRGSITTKLIATYAKLSEDNEWEYIEKETKRTSQDFATLMDEIFEHEKYEQIRKEKEELERKVREQREREEREQRERERAELEEQQRRREEELSRAQRQQELQEQMEQEIIKLKAEYGATERKKPNNRSSSAPMESNGDARKRDSTFEVKNDIKNLINTRNFSLQTRPVSRLDPGILANENRMSNRIDEEDISKEQTILETIRRSKFLGSQFNLNVELEKAKKEQKARERQEQIRKYSEQNEQPYEIQELPRNAKGVATLRDDEAEPRKLSEVKVPQFTRRSKHFSASNKRFSVLSMYSTKNSFTNLVDHLKNDAYLESTLPDVHEYPTSNGNQEPEFMFEAVEEQEEPSKLYEISENDNLLRSSENDTKSDTPKEISNPKPKDVNLPSLPPLQNSHNRLDEDGAMGLGIYQTNEDSEKSPKPDLDDEQVDENTKRETVQEERKKQELKENKAPLNDVMKKNNERKPLEEITPKVQNKRKISFFRKFSQGAEKKVGPASFDCELKASVSAPKMFKALDRLLKEWTDYGLKQVKSVPSQSVIYGKLTSDNILSLRSTGFMIAISEGEGNGSVIRFTKKTGSTKTFNRLVNEIEKILEKEKVLIFSS